MNLASRSQIKTILKNQDIRPSKRLGQNFLIDKAAVSKIIEAADLAPEDVVLEIGPGIGTLTQELAKRAKKVIAVEKDQKMVEILRETSNNFDNIEIIHADIRKIENLKLKIENSYKLVANLPFYLTAPVIRKFLENTRVQPVYLVLVVQKEVGQRICAKPPDMNLLAVSVQFYAKPKIISYISKKSFWPQPKVDSAIIKITPKPETYRERVSVRFFEIVRAGFSQPRKQLINNFSRGLNMSRERVKSWLLENSIQPSQRAETLNIEDWLKLTKNYIHSRFDKFR